MQKIEPWKYLIFRNWFQIVHQQLNLRLEIVGSFFIPTFISKLRMQSFTILSSSNSFDFPQNKTQKVNPQMNIRSLLTQRVNIMCLVKNYNRILQIQRTPLKQTPIQQIVERKNSQLWFLSKLLRVEIWANQLFFAVIFELMKI